MTKEFVEYALEERKFDKRLRLQGRSEESRSIRAEKKFLMHITKESEHI